MDPQLTSTGKPYAPLRYKEIVNERYLITKYTHTSYSDIGNITPTERKYLLEMIKNDIDKENEIKQKIINQNR